jgi:phenylalanyl-tRNA synthetase alpha chain
MLDEIQKIENSAKEELEKVSSVDDFENIKIQFLGRKGPLSAILRTVKDLPEDERRRVGDAANQLREDLEVLFSQKEKDVRKKTIEDSLKKEWIDTSHPGHRPLKGHPHPLSRITQEIEDIFQHMGFSIVEGPEIEDEYYNFDALNVPKDHPARDVQDTFWIKNKTQKKFLLRTQTSAVQIRYMQEHNPPFKIISPGRVFRHESTDASHEIQFYQVEGLMVGRKKKIAEEINIANFKGVMGEFFRTFFKKKDIQIQLRPAFFPFVEPGFEMYISCIVCAGKGCSVCKRSGWIEILGAGMVHPNVLKAVGYNPDDVQGFAFGMAIDRLAMMKYKIPDVRLFHAGDTRFLKQF